MFRWEGEPHHLGKPPTLVTFSKKDEMDEVWKILKERKSDIGIIVTQVKYAPFDKSMNYLLDLTF